MVNKIRWIASFDRSDRFWHEILGRLRRNDRGLDFDVVFSGPGLDGIRKDLLHLLEIFCAVRDDHRGGGL